MMQSEYLRQNPFMISFPRWTWSRHGQNSGQHEQSCICLIQLLTTPLCPDRCIAAVPVCLSMGGFYSSLCFDPRISVKQDVGGPGRQRQTMHAEYVRHAARMLTDVREREAAVTVVLGVSRTSVRR